MSKHLNLVLFDHPPITKSLLPFTFTRPVADIRIGIARIEEKWGGYLPCQTSFLTRQYLGGKFPAHFEKDNYYINGAVCPSLILAERLQALGNGEMLVVGDMPVAFRSDAVFTDLEALDEAMKKAPTRQVEKDFTLVQKKWDIFRENRAEIIRDFRWVTRGRQSFPIEDPHTAIYGREHIFVEEGASIRAATLNAENGPIYLGKNSCISEGAMVRGALALCEGATINMGAKIRGDNTFGDFCKIGGEVSNSVIFGYTNKSHDGYLGNSVVGEWCNFGADTNNSNLKNNYSTIRIWDYASENLENSGLQFCGLMMGDHSKSGINTMFNTGTVVGVSAIIFGGGFMDKFIPSFSWGGKKGGTATVDFPKIEGTIRKVMGRKKPGPLEEDLKILREVFDQTAKYREGNG